MTEMKRYDSVVRSDHREAQGVLKEGDYIVVYEKLDGSNASFRLGEDGNVRAFSRNRELDEDNTLQGFLGFAKSLDGYELNPDFIYFGEWLVKHKVDYGENQREFYLFDVYDTHSGYYLPHSSVVSEAYWTGLTVAPIMYAGKYKGYEHLQQFVGRSVLATEAEAGEGIVVKNPEYRDRHGKQVSIKFVSEAFREVKRQKNKPKNVDVTAEVEFVDTFVNEARVGKRLRDLVAEGELPRDYDITFMGDILKKLGSTIVDDIIQEEADSLPKDYDIQAIRKACGRKVPAIIRGIIEEESEERLRKGRD